MGKCNLNNQKSLLHQRRYRQISSSLSNIISSSLSNVKQFTCDWQEQVFWSRTSVLIQNKCSDASEQFASGKKVLKVLATVENPKLPKHYKTLRLRYVLCTTTQKKVIVMQSTEHVRTYQRKDKNSAKSTFPIQNRTNFHTATALLGS